jgi:hypothetical protein
MKTKKPENWTKDKVPATNTAEDNSQGFIIESSMEKQRAFTMV